MKRCCPACSVEAYARSKSKKVKKKSFKNWVNNTGSCRASRSTCYVWAITKERYKIHLSANPRWTIYFQVHRVNLQIFLSDLRAIFGEFAACWLAPRWSKDRKPNHAGQVDDQRFVADLLAQRCERSSRWIKVLPLVTVCDLWINIGTTIMERVIGLPLVKFNVKIWIAETLFRLR